MSNRIRVIGAAGSFVRIEVDGKPVTITEQDALAVAADLLRASFQNDPEGYRLIVDAIRKVATPALTLDELADKYDVTTRSLTYAKQNPNPVYASFGHQAFASKSKQQEIQRALYGTIKGLIAKA